MSEFDAKQVEESVELALKQLNVDSISQLIVAFPTSEVLFFALFINM